jgi:hypothetical protein
LRYIDTEIRKEGNSSASWVIPLKSIYQIDIAKIISWGSIDSEYSIQYVIGESIVRQIQYNMGLVLRLAEGHVEPDREDVS